MTKITAEHLARTAYVYIRQSTPDQLVHNQESQRRQYALADRARQLGWTGIEIVDDDLGRSGGGVARPGFDRLIGAICAGDVGAVLAIEASRLARNGRDWHMLIEFCGLVATIIVDVCELYARVPLEILNSCGHLSDGGRASRPLSGWISIAYGRLRLPRRHAGHRRDEELPCRPDDRRCTRVCGSRGQAGHDLRDQ
jgi:hypothetical protein